MRTLVVGLGRRGGDVVAKLPLERLPDGEVLFADTDPEDLERRPEGVSRLRLGSQVPEEEVTRNDLAFAARAAEAERPALEERLVGTDLVVLVAGLGGGTGAGAGAAIAGMARDLGVPSIALVTRPFSLEGEDRVRRGLRGYRRSDEAADLTVPFAQDALLHLVSRVTRIRELMSVADEFVLVAIEGLHALTEHSGREGLQALVDTASTGAFAYGVSDETRGLGEALEYALSCPFVDGLSLRKTSGLGVTILSRETMEEGEVGRALARLAATTSTDAGLLAAPIVRPELDHAVLVSLLLTGDLGEPATRQDLWVPGPSG